jgi:hypothetical protein
MKPHLYRQGKNEALFIIFVMASQNYGLHYQLNLLKLIVPENVCKLNFGKSVFAT